MSKSGRETLANVREWWEALLDVRKDSRMYGSGWEALLSDRKWTGGHLKFPKVVGWHSRIFGSGREAFLDVWV